MTAYATISPVVATIDRERRLLQAVALEAAEELRAGPEADGEEEEQEERLLDFSRDPDAELADRTPASSVPVTAPSVKPPSFSLPRR